MVLSSGVVGLLGDRFGRKFVLQYSASGYFGTGLFFLLGSVTKTYAFFALGGLIGGLTAPVLPHGNAFISDIVVALRRSGEASEQRAQDLGMWATALYAKCIYGGLVLGCLLTVVVSVVGGFLACFACSIVFGFITIIVNHFSLVDLPDKKSRIPSITCAGSLPNFCTLHKESNVTRSNGFTFGLSALIVVFYMTFFGMFTVMPNCTLLTFRKFFKAINDASKNSSAGALSLTQFLPQCIHSFIPPSHRKPSASDT